MHAFLYIYTNSLLRKLCANLWARHSALQCNFNQESLDLLIITYSGSIATDAIFDPAALSTLVVQIKYQSASALGAGDALRSIGISRHSCHPLPYIALLMELGNESRYQATQSKIRCTGSKAPGGDEFRKLTMDWIAAVQALRDQQKANKKGVKSAKVKKLKAVVEEKRRVMDSYNRFTISVRGVSSDVYGILKKARISDQFATLLGPSPIDSSSLIQHMRALGSAHTAWMREYMMPESENDA